MVKIILQKRVENNNHNEPNTRSLDTHSTEHIQQMRFNFIGFTIGRHKVPYEECMALSIYTCMNAALARWQIERLPILLLVEPIHTHTAYTANTPTISGFQIHYSFALLFFIGRQVCDGPPTIKPYQKP